MLVHPLVTTQMALSSHCPVYFCSPSVYSWWGNLFPDSFRGRFKPIR